MMSLSQSIIALFTSTAITAALYGFVSSFLFCVAIVATKRWHGVLSMDQINGVQKFHTEPTPRIGGVPIVLSIIVAWVNAPEDVQLLMAQIFISSMPAFIFGLAEDVTKRVGIIQRLLATMASGLLAWWITDYSLSRLDIIGIDTFMKITVVSVIFTAFAVGGVANAINIIDGFNGLASTMATLAFIGIGVIAWQVGDQTLANMSLIMASCLWGFFWVNWPFGKIFLGDGGSYFIGFVLAWFAVLLIERNHTVSTFAALVVCVHPVTEVLFSIFRRKLRKEHPGMPDRLHFHSLVKRRYVARWFSHYSSAVRNSITGVLIGFMTVPAIILASLTYASVALSFIAFASLSMGYVAIYARMVRHCWCSPISFLLFKPSRA